MTGTSCDASITSAMKVASVTSLIGLGALEVAERSIISLAPPRPR